MNNISLGISNDQRVGHKSSLGGLPRYEEVEKLIALAVLVSTFLFSFSVTMSTTLFKKEELLEIDRRYLIRISTLKGTENWNAKTGPLELTPHLNGMMVTLDPPSLKFLANSTFASTLFICTILFGSSLYISLLISSAHGNVKLFQRWLKFVGWSIVALYGMICAGVVYVYTAFLLVTEMQYPFYTSLTDGGSFTVSPPMFFDNPNAFADNGLPNRRGYHQSLGTYALLDVWYCLGCCAIVIIVSSIIWLSPKCFGGYEDISSEKQ